jgi:hypothetical protein
MSPHATQDEPDDKKAKPSVGRRSQQNATSSAGYSLSVDVSRPFAEHTAPSAPQIRKVNNDESEEDDEPVSAVAVPKKKKKSKKSKKKSVSGAEPNTLSRHSSF